MSVRNIIENFSYTICINKLEDIFNQSIKDDYAISVDGMGYEARMVYGIKIIKDLTTKNIEILNTTQGGDYYKSLNEYEIDIFLEKGWRQGVYMLSLSNYRLKLDLIEIKIHKEINGRSSIKQIKSLKTQREKILSKYTEINNKLNIINYGSSKKNKNKVGI